MKNWKQCDELCSQINASRARQAVVLNHVEQVRARFESDLRLLGREYDETEAAIKDGIRGAIGFLLRARGSIGSKQPGSALESIADAINSVLNTPALNRRSNAVFRVYQRELTILRRETNSYVREKESLIKQHKNKRCRACAPDGGY